MVNVEFLGPINKEPMNVNITNLNELSTILEPKNWLKSNQIFFAVFKVGTFGIPNFFC